MIKMINAMFGTEMWVSEDRVEDYLKAGHTLADSEASATKELATSQKRTRGKKK